MSNKLLRGSKDIRQIYDKQWTVTVIDQVDISALLQGFISCLPLQPIANAMVLPSGNIFVFTGMLDLCKNDDQLAVRQLIYICMYSFQEKAHTFSKRILCKERLLPPKVVLGHEMAHSVLGHTAEQLTRASFIQVIRLRALPTTCVLNPLSPSQLVLLVPFALLWAALPNDGVALVANWFFEKVYFAQE